MFMKLIVLLAVLAVASASFHSECDGHFSKFVSKHLGGSYGSDEEHAKRREIFCANMKKVDELNEMNGRPAFGVTKFADQTEEEINVLLGRKNNAVQPTEERPVRAPKSGGLFASDSNTVDWTAAGKVTPVKNQGQCGSCWAHSIAEQIESEWMLAGNAMWEFSVQQVNSCVKKCFGCGGGDTPAGYEYLMGLPKGEGLGSSAWAPYVQSMTTACSGPRCTEKCDDLDIDILKTKSSLTGPYATVTGYDYAVPACASGACNNQNMTLLAQNIASHGPASICVNAANWSKYEGGVMSTSACGGFAADDLDHCVQLTGYNADADTPYWIVRNSWATDWGENGYIYLQFDDTNPCGIANEATFVNLGNA
jgi:hypothetical protein